MSLVLLIVAGCGEAPAREATNERATGKTDETWRYWESLHQTAFTGDGRESVSDESEFALATSEDIQLAFSQWAEVERDRSRGMSALPVLGVDPDLTSYAVRCVEYRLQLAAMFDDWAAAMEQERQILSGDDQAAGFLLNLMQHAGDGDAALWNALAAQASETSTQIKQMQPLAADLMTRMKVLRDARAALEAEELRIRSTLAQRFDREFPPSVTFREAKPPTQIPPPSREQMARDLIGVRLSGIDWRFDDLREFQSFEILKLNEQESQWRQFDVATRVKGLVSGTEHDFRLSLTYRKVLTRWKLVEVHRVE